MSAELKAIEIKSVAAAADVTATGNGSAFDLRPYDGSVKLVLDCAAGASATTLDVKIQHSDNGTTWTDASVAFAQVGTTASFQVLNVHAEQFKRYIRAVDTVAGTTPSFARSVTFAGHRRA